MGEGFTDSVAGQSWLETPPATEPNPSQGSSPFRAGGSGSKMARAHGYQRGAGCWQEASVLHMGESSQHAASFTPEQVAPENKEEAAPSFIS